MPGTDGKRGVFVFYDMNRGSDLLVERTLRIFFVRTRRLEN